MIVKAPLYDNNFNTLFLLHQRIEEGVEVGVETFHEVLAYDDGVVVSEIQFGDAFLLVVLKYEAVSLEYSEIIESLRH